MRASFATDLIGRLTVAAKELERLVQAQLAEHMPEDIRLTMALVVWRIHTQKPHSVRDVYDKCYEGFNANETLRTLEQRGYLTRIKSKDDRHNCLIALTPKGVALSEKITLIVEYVEKMVGDLLPIKTVVELEGRAAMGGHQEMMARSITDSAKPKAHATA